MGNKDEKTFLDLFSSATKELDDNTLNNVEEENNDNDLNQTNEPLTFDNIFDNLNETETKEPLSNNIEPTKEEQNNNDNPFDFNSVFNNSTTQEEIKEESSLSTDNIELKNEDNNNISFDFDSVFNNTDNTNDEGTSTINTTNNISNEETKEDNPLFNQNIFFTQDNNNIDSSKDNLQTKDITLDQSNEVLSLTKEETSNAFENTFFKEETKEENVNPFFNEKEQTPIESNPFFTNEEISNQEVVETNPFFEDNSNTTNNNINNNVLDSVDNNQTPAETKEEAISTSPFFEVETKKEEEINPFFQNQINLVENQIFPNKNGKIDTNNTKHFNVKVVKKKEPFYKTIIGVLSYALFIWLLLIGAALLVYVLDIKIRAAKGDYSPPTFNAYVVLTGSMLPEIKVYDVVVTKKVDAADLKEGDVITFASSDQRFLGTIITHRIIKKNPPTETQGYTFQTRGDNNNVADSALVLEDNIFGKVILKIPKLGYLQEFLASDGGWIIVILIPCLAVISYDTVKLVKGLKKKKYKNIKVQK